MTDPDQTRAPDDAAVAFEAMRRQLALLSAAVEGFASRQEAIAARDYAPDLEKIAERLTRVNHNIGVLAERPGVALTLDEVTRQIDAATTTVRKADHAALAQAQHVQSQAAQQLDGLIDRIRTRAQQTDALVWAAMFGLVAAMLLILIGSAALERMGWRPSAETRAVALLGGDRWKAGQALMASEDPVRWRQIGDAVRLSDTNAEAIARCVARARKEGRPTRCAINVPPSLSRRSIEDDGEQ